MCPNIDWNKGLVSFKLRQDRTRICYMTSSQDSLED